MLEYVGTIFYSFIIVLLLQQLIDKKGLNKRIRLGYYALMFLLIILLTGII